MSIFSFSSFESSERSARTVAYRVQALKMRLPEWMQDWLDIIIPATQILLIVLAAWLLQYVLRRIVRRAGTHLQWPDELVSPIRGLIRWSIVAATVLLVLERVGVSATVLWTAFTGFATVAAVAFFAAWSVLSNLFCARLIFTARPFRVGDSIEVLDTAEKPGATGRVVDINLLYTTLEDYDALPGHGAWLQIPNALIFQRVVRRFHGTPPVRPVPATAPLDTDSGSTPPRAVAPNAPAPSSQATPNLPLKG